MKFLRAAVIAAFLMTSSVAADSFYFGVRFDAPVFLEQSNQTKAINADIIPTLGLQIGYDFDSLYAGSLGFRIAVSSDFNSGFRIGFDGYQRSSRLPELSSYLGFGGTVISASRLFSFNFRFLAGLEYQLVPGVGLFAEISPGVALGLTKNPCFPPADAATCVSLLPVVLEAAIGLNFRF
jgi:hypothetical protein